MYSPKTPKTAKEVNEQKWQRMNCIRRILREQGPKSSVEFARILFSSPGGKTLRCRRNLRSVQNYLAELEALNLISYDSALGKYCLEENKRVFQSMADYQLALQHSKDIFKGTIEFRMTLYDREGGLNQLAFLEEDKKLWPKDFGYFPGQNHEYLLQHIKTGYPEAQELIEKYKKLAIRKGVTSSLRGEQFKSRLTQKEERELVDITDLLIGKFLRLAGDVENGIALAGSCDGCPRRQVTVRDPST